MINYVYSDLYKLQFEISEYRELIKHCFVMEEKNTVQTRSWHVKCKAGTYENSSTELTNRQRRMDHGLNTVAWVLFHLIINAFIS